MRYKIGAVAKQFGITTQALRFYDKEGLLPALREKESGVRRYSARDIKWLCSLRRYHALGFSSDEIRRLYACEEPSEVEQIFREQMEETENEVAGLYQRAQILRRNLEGMKQIERLYGSCEIVSRPAMFLLINQKGQHLDSSPDTVNAVRNWMQHMDLLWSASAVDQAQFADEHAEVERRSGFAIPVEFAGAEGLCLDAPVEFLRPCRCVHTVAVLDRDGIKGPELFAHVFRYLREHKLRPCADATGCDRLRLGEGNCSLGKTPKAIYYEYWIPVEEA